MLRRRQSLLSLSSLLQSSTGMKRKSTTTVDEERLASQNEIANGILDLEKQLVHELTNSNITYDSTVKYIYNPLDYAFDLHSKYVHKYGNSKKKLLFLGMNPGPFGMVQCGIPFGEVKAVKSFLEIHGEVTQPKEFHKDRPIKGLDCPRSEISGKRLWELASQLSKGDAKNFFHHAYVHNYNPLAYLSKTATNITPAELKNKATVEKLNAICDKSLADIIRLLEVDTVIAIGKFTETRAEKALKNNKVSGVRVTSISHPSPRNPASNKNWIENTTKKLKEIGVLKYFKSD